MRWTQSRRGKRKWKTNTARRANIWVSLRMMCFLRAAIFMNNLTLQRKTRLPRRRICSVLSATLSRHSGKLLKSTILGKKNKRSGERKKKRRTKRNKASRRLRNLNSLNHGKALLDENLLNPGRHLT